MLAMSWVKKATSMNSLNACSFQLVNESSSNRGARGALVKLPPARVNNSSRAVSLGNGNPLGSGKLKGSARTPWSPESKTATAAKAGLRIVERMTSSARKDAAITEPRTVFLQSNLCVARYQCVDMSLIYLPTLESAFAASKLRMHFLLFLTSTSHGPPVEVSELAFGGNAAVFGALYPRKHVSG
jgi:hypothetical protein